MTRHDFDLTRAQTGIWANFVPMGGEYPPGDLENEAR